MKYRYYITDTMDGCLKGTNKQELAEQMAHCEDYFVVDADTGTWMTFDVNNDVEEFRPQE